MLQLQLLPAYVGCNEALCVCMDMLHHYMYHKTRFKHQTFEYMRFKRFSGLSGNFKRLKSPWLYFYSVRHVKQRSLSLIQRHFI